MADGPVLHELKAKDFHLVTKPWREMGQFPRDGSKVEVEDERGDVHLAYWRGGSVVLYGAHPRSAPITPKHWRPL